MKKIMSLFIAAALAVTGTVNLYAQSNKLIGTWIEVGPHRGFSVSDERKVATIVSITKDTITIYPAENRDRGFVSYTWNDPFNDGIAIKIEGSFTPYIVTENNLFITFPYDNRYGYPGGTFYLTKHTIKPATALMGKWIHPTETGDIEVTITKDKISLKKGRLVNTLDYSLDEKLPRIIVMRAGYQTHYRPYYFADDTHVVICFDSIQNTEGYSESSDMIYYLTKQ